MKNVGFLRENHSGESHSGAPEIFRGAELPEPERAKDKQHREKQDPDFVDGIAPVKNETGRNGHGQRGQATNGAADKRFEFQGQPHATDADQDDGQSQRNQIAPKQGLRHQQQIKM